MFISGKTFDGIEVPATYTVLEHFTTQANHPSELSQTSLNQSLT